MLVDTNTLEQKLDIPADMVPKAVKAVERANRRLDKAGIKDRFDLKHTLYEVIKKDDGGGDVAVKRAKLVLNRPSISYDGYTFMARVEEVAPGKFVAFSAPGIELAGWRPDSMKCEHCNKNRARTKVYVIKDKDDTYKVVGGNCIALYTGLSPAALWSLEWDALEEYSNTDWENDPSTRTVRVYATDTILTLAYTLIKRYGYSPVDRGNSTRDTIVYLIDGNGHVEDRDDIFKEAAGYDAADIRKRIKTHLEPHMTDWGTNILAVIDNEYVEANCLGLLASAPIPLVKEEQKAAFNDEFKNDWFEPVGARVTGYEVTLIDKKSRYESYGYNTNEVFLLTFRDSFGHRIFWKTSSTKIPEMGVKVLMDFTVKDHNEFKGVKSTRIARARWMLALA